MKQMWDKKEIEKIAQESGSNVSVTTATLTGKVDSITIDGVTSPVSPNTVTGVGNESYWTDLTINGTNKLVPPVVSGVSQDNYWQSITINGVTKATSSGTPDGKTIILNEPAQQTRVKGSKARAAEPVMETCIGGWHQDPVYAYDTYCNEAEASGFNADDYTQPIFALGNEKSWSNLLEDIFGTTEPSQGAQGINAVVCDVYQNGIQVQHFDAAPVLMGSGGAVCINALQGANRISLVFLGAAPLIPGADFRAKVYPAGSTSAITFAEDDEILFTLRVREVATPEQFHPIDSRYIALADGLKLDSQNNVKVDMMINPASMSGALDLTGIEYCGQKYKVSAACDGKTIIDGNDGFETAIGGWYEASSEVLTPVDGFDEEDNVGYVTATEPYWSINLGINGFKVLLGIPNQGNYIEGNATVKLNGTQILALENVRFTNNGPTGVTVGATTGANRLSFATASGISDAVRCKVYVTSSAYTFDTANDTVEITLEIPQPVGPAVYHPMDGRYLPIDGVTITLNSNNQLQAASSQTTLYAHNMRLTTELGAAQVTLISSRSTAYDIPNLAAYLYNNNLRNSSGSMHAASGYFKDTDNHVWYVARGISSPDALAVNVVMQGDIGELEMAVTAINDFIVQIN